MDSVAYTAILCRRPWLSDFNCPHSFTCEILASARPSSRALRFHRANLNLALAEFDGVYTSVLKLTAGWGSSV
jgi:hypothetical protein